ncbi:ABC transporter permease [Undibacterium sp. YM2]|uniref:ABC transporter permease/substrate-binding protein n=1 Tax=Undibacterium sp. YM2 TaxID=2058625 RepID=UPI001331CA63|nr:glycine betaine ABC transporter substrate-binding protein [Undibacterium sp. YM2]BBB70047.1 ABC transporter permease [Undibacterium sp. YM2]
MLIWCRLQYLLSLALKLCLLSSFAVQAHAADTLKVGSKRFTESYVLGEILMQTAVAHSPALHQQGLGNTAIVFNALKNGSIDVYPEYMGTINTEILKHEQAISMQEMQAELAKQDLGVTVPLGFNNTYALAMRPDAGDIKSLTDLAKKSELRFGLSHEFLGRADGWPGLVKRYHLPQQASGLDHGIAYEALTAKQVDVIDIYSTDAKIKQLGLRVLVDDANYFPRYDAVLLYRLDVPARFPQAWAAIQKLEGKIDNAQMIAMNAAVEIDGQSFAQAAQQFVAKSPATTVRAGFMSKLFGADFLKLTWQHLTLVLLSVALACLVGIPLGIIAAFAPRLREIVMATVGILQTIPSLALLAMLIPLLGRIGFVPALITLSLYALLPIVRNTCVGLVQVPAGLLLAAQALGLSSRDRLLNIDLPLALPMILAGVKTAAVMSVGTATIAAFIGAGGYGERITIGLALNDNQMLLAGALPAAALALLTQWGFDLLEKVVVRKRD